MNPAELIKGEKYRYESGKDIAVLTFQYAQINGYKFLREDGTTGRLTFDSVKSKLSPLHA